MAIVEYRFRQPVRLNKGEHVGTALKEVIQEGENCKIQPLDRGKYDITPENWDNPDCFYRLTVRSDGRGVLWVRAAGENKAIVSTRLPDQLSSESWEVIDKHSPYFAISERVATPEFGTTEYSLFYSLIVWFSDDE